MTDSLSVTAAEPSTAQLLDVRAVARLLGCSSRHVYRLSDGGRMPKPVKLGALVRWRRQALEDWIAAGCPALRNNSTR
jgi:excisionase family DNA binding protein